MGNRVILSTIIVAVAIMMIGSAVMPAMAQPIADAPPTKDPTFCDELFNKLLDAGIPFVKALLILSRMGC